MRLTFVRASDGVRWSFVDSGSHSGLKSGVVEGIRIDGSRHGDVVVVKGEEKL